VRVNANQGVGLVTCTQGHHSLLLDSRDHWGDVIQGGRPRQTKCRCKAKVFAVSLDYTFREDGGAVSHVEAHAECDACGKSRRLMSLEIDYEPTDALVERPLDPITDPWIKAKRFSAGGYWKVDDLFRVVSLFAEEPGAVLYFAGWDEAPRALSKRETIDALHGAGWHAVAGQDWFAERRSRKLFYLFATNQPLELPENPRDCWKRLPVVQVKSPQGMNCSRGHGWMYSVRYAEEVFRDGKPVPQSAEFLTFARRLIAALRTYFSSPLGPHSLYNPDEYERLKD
jgi:hypothetical protein